MKQQKKEIMYWNTLKQQVVSRKEYLKQIWKHVIKEKKYMIITSLYNRWFFNFSDKIIKKNCYINVFKSTK